MLVVIRISGQVEIRKDIKATLDRLRLRKKFACVLLKEKPEFLGMLEKVKFYVAFGKIDKQTLTELISKRGRLPGNKPVDKDKITSDLIDSVLNGKKKLTDIGLKPFFSLHPPRGGFRKSTKFLYPKGVLGDWKEEINSLVKRML